MRTRSRDSRSSPARATITAVSPAAIGCAFAVAGVEAEEAQDAQIVLADARRRVADEAHLAALEIRKPADMVMHRAVGARATGRSW